VEAEVNELAVEAAGLRVTVRVASGTNVWQVTRAAFEAAKQCSGNNSSLPLQGSDDELFTAPRDGSTKLDQIRDIARLVLADGRVHERREIARAVRKAGLDPNPLNKALDGHFERGTNMDRRPTYRDATVPSPYVDPRTVPEDEKPVALRNRPPAHEPGDVELIEAHRNGAP
jgi:hypothetical protein